MIISEAINYPRIWKYVPIENVKKTFDIDTLKQYLTSHSWIINNGKFNDQVYFVDKRIPPDSIAPIALYGFRHKISPNDTSGLQDDFFECAWFLTELNGNPILGLTYFGAFGYQLFIVKSIEHENVVAQKLNNYSFDFTTNIDTTIIKPELIMFMRIENLTNLEISKRKQKLESVRTIEKIKSISSQRKGETSYMEYMKLSQDSTLTSIQFDKDRYKISYSDGFVVEGPYKISVDGAFIIINNGLEDSDYIKIDWETMRIDFEDKICLPKAGRYYRYKIIRRSMKLAL